MRVVIADDSTIMREGIAALLGRAGIEVAAQADCADGLLRAVAEHESDVAIIDIRMPPTFTDDGLRAARAIRERVADVGVLVLSSYLELGYAVELLRGGPTGVGYLLKDRVADVDAFADAVRRVAGAGAALDREVVAELADRPRRPEALATLSAVERELLELIAEGQSNNAFAAQLYVSVATVEARVAALYTKLGVSIGEGNRVVALVEFLQGRAG